MKFGNVEKFVEKQVMPRLESLEIEVFGEEKPGSEIVSKISSLESRMEELEAKLQRLQTVEENLRDFQEKYEKEQAKNSSLLKEIAALKQELKQKEETIDGQEETISAMKQQMEDETAEYEKKLDEKQSSIEELENQKDEMSKNLEDARRRSSQKDKELEQSRASLEEAEQRFHNEKQGLQAEIERLEKEAAKLSKDLSDEKAVTEQYAGKFGNWDKDTHEYSELLDAAFACGSLDKMMEDYGIDKSMGAENVANIIHFTGLLGNQTSFLPILYDYLEEYKGGCREFLNSAEQGLFSKLNSYYKEVFGFTYDVLRYPQAGERFDKAAMKDMDSRIKAFRAVEGVYVPAVMRDETDYLMLALIKGA